jgi:uncharacterized protein YndB with AHSA1/START domain
MPTVTGRRDVGAPPEAVWAMVSDPERLPAWWPGVRRVEDATALHWTTVLTSSRGKVVRADWSRVEAEPERRMVWRQELEESPFERILRESVTAVELAPGGDGGTAVSVTVRHRPRGLARLGYFQMRGAAAKQVRGALDGLAAAMEA